MMLFEPDSDAEAGGPRADDRTGTPVPAVVKAISVIRALNGAPSLGLTLAEIAGDLAITKSHCHNILKTLVTEGWATFDADRRRYTLAPRLLSDIGRLVARQDRSSMIHDEIVRLSASARVPCVVTRIDPDGSFVAVDKAEEASELIVSVPIGHRFPADAPAQMRARLAFSPAAVRREALARWRPVAYTRTTIVSRAALAEELDRTRARGYAISREEYSPGVTSFAVPIFNAAGEVHLVLQCPGMTAAMEPREADIAGRMMAAADRINRVFRDG